MGFEFFDGGAAGGGLSRALPSAAAPRSISLAGLAARFAQRGKQNDPDPRHPERSPRAGRPDSSHDKSHRDIPPIFAPSAPEPNPAPLIVNIKNRPLYAATERQRGEWTQMNTDKTW